MTIRDYVTIRDYAGLCENICGAGSSQLCTTTLVVRVRRGGALDLRLDVLLGGHLVEPLDGVEECQHPL